MNRQKNKEIAKETMQITKQGWYIKDGNRIELPKADYSRVIVISPDEAKAIEATFKQGEGHRDAEIIVIEADSFLVANEFHNCLVMNFANAHTPGGGFLNGANAQEECLCRQSTLYSSIGNDMTAKMYQYNREHKNKCDSDYMLFSPNVCVFRDIDGELLDEPFLTSVITVPAPNRNGAAKYIIQSKLDMVMKSRIRKMLSIARKYEYTNLILGAWGCGAFGHNPHKVAEYFYELLLEEGYKSYFSKVVFTIIDTKNKPNLLAFSDVFKDVAEIYYDGDNIPYPNTVNEKAEGYYQSKWAHVTFNFSPSNFSKENIGYAYGVTNTGHPFMAETWKYGSNQDVAFYLPVIEDFMKKEGTPLINQETQTKTFSVQAEAKGFHALCVGMVDKGFVDDLSVMNAYLVFLCKCGLLHFESNMYNGYAFLLTDNNGQDLIAITVSLVMDSKVEATTPLSWTLFPKLPKRSLHVVKSLK